jgi:hypothetical protein
MDVSYFLSREKVVPSAGTDRGLVERWRTRLFAAMARNAGSVTDFALVIPVPQVLSAEDVTTVDSALFADLVARQRALAEQARSSALFAEIGAGAADGSGAATAWDRVEAAARKLMDADGGLSKPAAIDRVLMTDKALAAEYAAEQRPWANGGRR